MSYIDILRMFLTPTPVLGLDWTDDAYPQWWVRTGLEIFDEGTTIL